MEEAGVSGQWVEVDRGASWALLTVSRSLQTVEMHKEKVSRREIGVFTAVRRVPRSQKILPPQTSGVQPRPAYSRRPINYQQLDGVGHGMKVGHR